MIENYPEWAKNLARKYLSRTLCQFILHGNTHDLVPVGKEGDRKYLRLKSFLGGDFFGAREFVIFYDRSSGISFRDSESREDFYQALSSGEISDGQSRMPRRKDTFFHQIQNTSLQTDPVRKASFNSGSSHDYPAHIACEPVRAFALIEQYLRLRLGQDKSAALIIDFAETIVPMNDAGMSSSDDRDALVCLMQWAHDPLFLASDFTTVLITENLSDLNTRLIQNPHNAEVRLPIPSEWERVLFLQSELPEKEYKKHSEVAPDVLARQTAGLNYIHIRNILSNAMGNASPVTLEGLSEVKKELIEAEAFGLMEFVETDETLDAVAGHAGVKKHLRHAAKALREGRNDVIPMGYLVCGPIGTGKTWMVNCFAGEVGIPMVKLKNFRSQWQGVTEGNLEKILFILKAMAPVAVMIDEADAYLGNRKTEGDSGVSSRVFSKITSFMSETSNRGRVIWFLITARPDLMPVDLKRQGRAEEHLALFPPSTREERVELYEAMCRKTGLKLSEEFIPVAIEQGTWRLSGADMEAALTRAKFRAAAEGETEVTPAVLDDTLQDFLSPGYPEEIELQILNAVIECTSRELLPEEYRMMDRSSIMERIELLKDSRSADPLTYPDAF